MNALSSLAPHKLYTESNSKIGVFRSRSPDFELGEAGAEPAYYWTLDKGEANSKAGMKASKNPIFESRAVYNGIPRLVKPIRACLKSLKKEKSVTVTST